MGKYSIKPNDKPGEFLGHAETKEGATNIIEHDKKIRKSLGLDG